MGADVLSALLLNAAAKSLVLLALAGLLSLACRRASAAARYLL